MKKAKLFYIIIFSLVILLGVNTSAFASSSLINKQYKSINVYEKFDIKKYKMTQVKNIIINRRILL